MFMFLEETLGVNDSGEYDEEANRVWEECVWQSGCISDACLLRYLNSARSIAAFAGMCNRGSADDMYEAAQSDQTTIYAIDVLHQMQYDSSRALQYLAKHPAPPGYEGRNLNEEESVWPFLILIFTSFIFSLII